MRAAARSDAQPSVDYQHDGEVVAVPLHHVVEGPVELVEDGLGGERGVEDRHAGSRRTAGRLERAASRRARRRRRGPACDAGLAAAPAGGAVRAAGRTTSRWCSTSTRCAAGRRRRAGARQAVCSPRAGTSSCARRRTRWCCATLPRGAARILRCWFPFRSSLAGGEHPAWMVRASGPARLAVLAPRPAGNVHRAWLRPSPSTSPTSSTACWAAARCAAPTRSTFQVGGRSYAVRSGISTVVGEASGCASTTSRSC